MSADTPLMQQYKKIKEEYKDKILMYRLGDFYEMFFEDAKIASKELGLTLTKRNKEKNEDVPLAGVPYHSVASYIAKLVKKGYSVAICDQVEDPKIANGIVKREVTRIITPGTIIDTDFLDETKNNYIMCLKINSEKFISISYADITTGEFSVFEIEEKDTLNKLFSEINKISPSEIIFDNKTQNIIENELRNKIFLENVKFNVVNDLKKPKEYLQDFFNVISLESFSLKDKELSISCSANLLSYIKDLQKDNELPFKKIIYKNVNKIMELNLNTQINLDLFSDRMLDSKGTLFGVLNSCMTSLGSRKLRKMIKNPFLDKKEIENRLDYVDYFFEKVLLREEIRNLLEEVYDIERILGKIVLGTENGKDLISLKISIRKSLELYKKIKEYPEILKIFDVDVEKLLIVHNLIEESIDYDAPFSIREGGIIKDFYNSELDELRNISKNGKNFILEMEIKERERTGIKGLKIKYNKVLGYFIEITKANSHLVPREYIRKQTLVNGERYTVDELKKYEEKVITAKEKIEALEYQIFKEISTKIKEDLDELSNLAEKIADIDVITNFSHIAVKNSYVRPKMVEENILEMTGVRHPIVELLIEKGKYVKNNIKLNAENNLIILTGPNMSGKSTYMKQIALNIIMAHMGCYVAADYAIIPITDKIFTRVGANDDLLSGQSTFMLEMTEVANILNNATEKSFIILDEIGRGTSTYDGISIATAITEYIHDKIFAKTIFATHFHELTELENKLERVKNFRVEVKESGKKVIFLREIVEGGADKSYGIEVAKLSGVPTEILNRAKKILEKLEDRKNLIEKKIKTEQMMLFSENFTEEEKEEEIQEEISSKEREVINLLESIDINSLSPIDSLLKLSELKKILSGGTSDE